MANPYYRITVKQTSKFGSSGRGGSTKNLLKNWLRTYVDQRAKQEKESEEETLDAVWTRDGEGRLRVPLEFYSATAGALTTTANNRNPFSRTDIVHESDSANLWAGGFLAGQYGLARRPEEQSYLSSAAADLEEIAQGTNRQKEWIQKLAHQWDQLLASPLTTKKRSHGIRYAISLDIQANQQLAASGIPTALALRVILNNTLRTYARVEGFEHNQETLGWVAGLHQDKEHLHLHVALFPTTSHGTPLRLSDKQNSAHTGDQHLTRLVAIANIEAEKFWRKELPDYTQNPAVQLARLQNQIDPPQGVDLQTLLPIYCGHNKKLKLFPNEIALNAFNQIKTDEADLRDLVERIRVLNALPDNNPAAIFATAKRHAREKHQIQPKDLQRLQELRKLCLRYLWNQDPVSHETLDSSTTVQFAHLFQQKWANVLEELQELSQQPKSRRPVSGMTEIKYPNLQSLLSFGQTLVQKQFLTPVTEQTAAALKAPDYWFHWIKKRQQELYQVARDNQVQEQERKNKYLDQLNETLLALDQGRATTAEQALASLKTTYPLLQLQLAAAVNETSPSLQRTVLRQKLILEIENAQRSPGPLTPNPEAAKTDRLAQLQGLRLLIQAAQLQKNEETRLNNTFRTRPGTVPTSVPAYLTAESTGCLSWIQQILQLEIRPAGTAALAQEINNLSPKEILLQNPELLWELRQLALRKQSRQSFQDQTKKDALSILATELDPQNPGQPSTDPHSLSKTAPAATLDRPESAVDLSPPASSQILDLLKGFDLNI
jgi:hypothetical protein